MENPSRKPETGKMLQKNNKDRVPLADLLASEPEWFARFSRRLAGPDDLLGYFRERLHD